MSSGPWRLALSFQATMTQASWVGVRLMIGYRALDEGAGPAFLGLLASSFALPALIAALPAGRAADRLGGAVLAFVGLMAAAAGIGFMLLVPGLSVLLAASMCVGLGHLLIIVGQQSFVAHVSRGGSSDGAFGTLTAAASVGQMIGPPAVTIIASLGLPADSARPDTTVGLLVCIAFSVLAWPVYFRLRPIDRTLRRLRRAGTQEGKKAPTLLRTPGLWRSLAVSGAVLVTVDLMYAFIPVWATEQGVSATAVGLLLALRAAVSVVSRVGLTRLITRFGRKTLLAVSIGAATLGLLSLPLVGLHGAILVMIGLGLGLGIPQPITMAWVIALTDASRHGSALGLRMTVNRFAQITLPIAVGTFAGPLGTRGIFWANAAVLAGALIIVAGSAIGKEMTPPDGEG